MEDTASDSREIAIGLAEILKLHKGEKVQALDMRDIGFWTDYFIIANATSSTHMRGLMKHVKDYLAESGIETLRKHSGGEDDDWNLVDCGQFVVHLMSERARGFYELEKLWFQAKTIYRSE